MLRTFYYLISILVLHSCSGKFQHSIKPEEITQLIEDLTEIGVLDQKFRNTATELRVKNGGIRTDEEGQLWAEQTLLDSINMLRIEKIIANYGYPGMDMVGSELKSVAALVIIHNPQKQEKYLSLLWRAAEKDQVEKKEIAMLDDRINMLKGKKQKFGTALKYEPIGVDSITGKTITKLRIWDIECFEHLDKKREEVGWYSFKLQCEIGGFDWKQFEKYVPKVTKYDFKLN